MNPMQKESSDRLSPLELEIMQVLWKLESASTQEVEEALPKGRQLESTIVDSESALQVEKRINDPLGFYL